MFRQLVLCLAILSCIVGCQLMNPISPILQIGMYWIEGEAHKYYNTDQAEIHRAMQEVLDELEFPIIEESEEGQIIYMKADADKLFKIKLNAVRHNVTKVSIRVNTFGDRPYAEMIYRHLDDIEGIKQFASLKKLNTAMEDRPRRR